MKYYRVTAKCGHVRRSCYLEKDFYVKAENGKDAARIVRMTGRVKHDHPDAIRNVCEINEGQYRKGCEEHAADPFFQCKNRQEQNALGDLIGRVIPEKNSYLAKRALPREEIPAPSAKRSEKFGHYKNRRQYELVVGCRLRVDAEKIYGSAG